MIILEYVKGSLFLLTYIFLLYLIGSGFVKKEKSFIAKFLMGYVILSFAFTPGGILIQLVDVPWLVYFIYWLLIIVSLVAFSIYRFIHKEDYSLKIDLRSHLKNYWFVYILAGILIVFSVLNISWLWQNNLTDDGYYLSKLATYPFTDHPFSTSAASGFRTFGKNARIFNTYELEYSGFMYLFNVAPTIFARVFLSLFNYYLFIQCILGFAMQVNAHVKRSLKKHHLQYLLGVLLFFGFYFSWHTKLNLVFIDDGWRFNTAMWYGSMVVMTMSFFLILLPVMERDKIEKKDFIYFIIISTTLISRASQALPILYLVGVCYLLHYLIASKTKRNYIFSVIIIFLILVVSLFLGGFDKIGINLYKALGKNINTVLFYVSIFIFALSFFLKSKYVRKWNFILLGFFALMTIPFINRPFFMFSQFKFVAARTYSMFIYTFLATNMIYIFIMLYQAIKKVIVVMITGLIGFSATLGFMANRYYVINKGEIRNIVKQLISNPYIYPQSSVDLGKELENIRDDLDVKMLDVLMPNTIFDDGYRHFPSIVLRTYAPNIRSVSALARYKMSLKGSEYEGMNKEKVSIYTDFLLDPVTIYPDFSEMINKYEVDCIIAYGYEYDEYLSELGYTCYAEVNVPNGGFDYGEKAGFVYTIYIRNSILK